MSKNILVCDVGGTSSRFGLFSLGENILALTDTQWHKTKHIKSFGELLDELDSSPLNITTDSADAIVFAVAGPVVNGVRCSPPNIDWQINLADYDKRLKREKVSLVNDFVAQAFAVLGRLGEEAEIISEGQAVEGSPIAVVGAGTGLGKALLFPKQGRYCAVPSEGGHVNFCAESEDEFRFAIFAAERLKQSYLVWDRVTSGQGLELVHEFLTGQQISAVEISQRCLGDESCETFKWFSRFYGRVCRNYVLETLALGGLFVAGGIAAKNPQLLRSKDFIRSFTQSSKYSDMLGKVPIRLQGNEEAGLWGAATIGQSYLSGRT